MEIILSSISIKNFKGIKKLDINFGQNTNIYGENATGKTTVFDAFTWLLFDKDSSNKKDFNIKTLGKGGEAYHGLEHCVEGTLIIDGRPLNLKKIFTEKWVKQRGSIEKVFSGHETNYWINEVPVKKNEYQNKISSLMDENIFKLITNPLFFNMNLSWQDRRKTLLEIVGDISDRDVIDSKEELSRLSMLLQDKSLDEFKVMIAGQKKRFNEQLKSIPIRIDELSRNIPTLDADVDYANLEQEKKDLQIIIGSLERDLTDQRKIAMDMMNDFKKKQSVIANKRNELNKLENDLNRQSMKSVNDINNKIYEFRNIIESKKNIVSNNERKINTWNEDIISLDTKIAKLRTDYSELVKTTFDEPDRNNFICPTCKQKLPEENIENQISTMEINFLNDKKSNLENINRTGKNLAADKKEIQERIENYKSQIESAKADIEKYTTEKLSLEEQLKEEQSKIGQVNYESDEKYQAIKTEIRALEKELEDTQLQEVDSSDLINKKQNCNDRISEINKTLNNKQVIADTQKRIVELEQEQIDIAGKVLDLEGQEYLAEQFIRTKVDMLESRINSKFSQVSFKMFNEQINGALVECCDTLIKGVPFQDANNAAKINAGMDIINTLTAHYGITAPIFVDNREAVNRLIDTDSQVINLIVSQDKVLRVEVQ